MNSISQNIRYYPHDLNTKFYATKLYKSGYPISSVCRKYKILKSSLLRWNKKFDGTEESLYNKSHRLLTKHHYILYLKPYINFLLHNCFYHFYLIYKIL